MALSEAAGKRLKCDVAMVTDVQLSSDERPTVVTDVEEHGESVPRCVPVPCSSFTCHVT